MAPIAFNPPLLLRSRLPALGGYAVVRVVLGLLLLAAAGLKTHQLVTQPPIGAGLLDSRWLLAGVVEFELFFGLWLLAGLYPQSTRRAAIVCFAIFGCVALYEALSGTPSCGCFGVVPVNPWHTLILDAAAVGALIGFRPAPGSAWPLRQTVSCGARTTERRRIGWLAVSWIALAVSAGVAIGTHRPATLDESGKLDAESPYVFLEPRTWVGKPCPLLRDIDIGDWDRLPYGRRKSPPRSS